jgi:hypothetical protein
MKRKCLFVVLGIFILLFGCSLNTKAYKINPPSWIIGTWSDEYSINQFRFTEHNIVLSIPSLSVDMSEAFKSANINEDISISTYRVNASQSGTTLILKFDKVNSTSINYYVTSSGITVGPITLGKK